MYSRLWQFAADFDENETELLLQVRRVGQLFPYSSNSFVLVKLPRTPEGKQTNNIPFEMSLYDCAWLSESAKSDQVFIF